MNDILNTILKDTFTLTELHHRLRILKSYLLNSFFAGQKTSEIYSAEDSTWLKSLPSPIYQKFTKDNIYEIFSELEEDSKKLPILTMYLSFEADDPVFAQIGTLVRKTFDSSVLLDGKFDPTLIAGCALSWKGIFRDFSLRAKIKAEEAEILESFKKFLR